MPPFAVFWDLRNGAAPSKMTSIEKSHKDPVYEITWIQSKHHECMSTSTDGQVLWWDTRKMSESTDTYTLDTSNKPDTVMGIQGGTSLGYDVAAGPLKFLVGTEQGYIHKLSVAVQLLQSSCQLQFHQLLWLR